MFDGVEISLSESAISIRSGTPMKILSSAPIRGGYKSSTDIVNMNVNKNFNEDPEAYVKSKLERLGLNGEAVCLMTAANLTKAAVSIASGSMKVAAVVTAGTSNATSISDGVSKIMKIGTINIIVIVDRNVSDACMVNMVQSVTEAKCNTLSSLDIRSIFTADAATGTSSDAVLVASLGRGEPASYAGSATEMGHLIGKAVTEALRQVIVAHDSKIPHRPLVTRLAERGITEESLVSTAEEMLAPHPGVPMDRMKEVFVGCLREAMEDINICSLVMAACRLDEDGSRGLVPGLEKETYDTDPVILVADEIIGLSIANYIAGYHGIFEFYRFDRKKPGVLKTLPPFVDDAIGALLAGASSKMYSRVLGSHDG